MPDVRPITTQQQLPRVKAPDEKYLSFSTGTETHAPYRLILTRTSPSHEISTTTVSSEKFPAAAPVSLIVRKSCHLLLENMTSVAQGFTKSLAMTVLSEIGDKTFFAAAILAMRHPRRLVLSGCLAALIVMTILSAIVGWAAPNLISRTWTHHITTILFFGFGFWSLWDGFNDKGEAEELAEVEAKLDADWKANTGTTKAGSKDDDKFKKQRRPFLSQLFSPILLKAFSITFFGEWGDKSQLATIGLAADENPLGVVLGGIVGQALCTTAAVVGGKTLASQISEKIVALSGGVLFIIFGIQSFLSVVE
ncbi:PREDICTED: GDT1-like protein 4 [Populus euphratica]|uniref:GDT1 family protein n=1 Tax=Populus euphratica TaxID=75702 RepID=A0AAJ6X7N3_POPEU|nr:PREDICTED: GDT1-like protein 4 [Populus euphratica]